MPQNSVRQLRSPQDFIDVITSIPGGQYATFCYVNVANVYKQKNKVDMDAFGRDMDANKPEGNDPVYDELQNWRNGSKSTMPITIISLTKYTVNWSTAKNYDTNCSKYLQAKDEIDARYGHQKDLDRSLKTHDNQMRVDIGSGVHAGAQLNNNDCIYLQQNIAKPRHMSTKYYAVNKEGHIIGVARTELIQSLRKAGASQIPSDLKAILTDEQQKEYLRELEALNFKPGKFRGEKILYIVATVDGQPICYINKLLTNEISKSVTINPSEFIAIAAQEFDKDEALTESFDEAKATVVEHARALVAHAGIQSNAADELIESIAHRAIVDAINESITPKK